MAKTKVCADCGELKKIHARGLCENCYAAFIRRKKGIPKREKRVIVCPKCGQTRGHYAKGICRPCYMREYEQRPEVKARRARQERKRRRDNKERYREYDRRRSKTKKRKEWCRKYNHGYYRENAEKLKEYAIEYRKADKTRQTVYKQRRRNRVKGLESTLTPDQWQEILKENNHSCFYCGKPVNDLEMEHQIPASKNGGFTAENIVPACGECNRRKKDMTVEEFYEYLLSVGETPNFEPSKT